MRLVGRRAIGQTVAVLASSIRFSSFDTSSVVAAAMSTNSPTKIIDSHLHVWANAEEAANGYPYVVEPPESLQNKASYTSLLEKMESQGVDGALIVQPINYKFDHSYVSKAIQLYPEKFKGMLLLDPSLSQEEALKQLDELHAKGFVGVRFNPYLWPSLGEKKSPMSEGTGLAVYKRCGELKMPVGVMCFQGLSLHYDDIVQLATVAPETTLILDHFGFTALDDDGTAFDQLLSLHKFPQVYVKVSALFRLNDQSTGFTRVQQERFVPLLKAFGANRLMYGSDFPYVLEQQEQYGIVKLVWSWIESDEDKAAILGGTAQQLFGPWGKPSRDEL